MFTGEIFCGLHTRIVNAIYWFLIREGVTLFNKTNFRLLFSLVTPISCRFLSLIKIRFKWCLTTRSLYLPLARGNPFRTNLSVSIIIWKTAKNNPFCFFYYTFCCKKEKLIFFDILAITESELILCDFKFINNAG